MKVMTHPHRNRYLRGLEDCVSVTFPKGTRGDGVRTLYYGAAWLSDVVLRVQPAGVARAQRENVRNVHAWAVGNVLNLFHTQWPYRPLQDEIPDDEWRKVTYHFNSGEFRFLDTGENVTGREFPLAHIVGRDLFVLDMDPNTLLG